MPWKKLTDLKKELNVGDRVDYLPFDDHVRRIVTAVGEKKFFYTIDGGEECVGTYHDTWYVHYEPNRWRADLCGFYYFVDSKGWVEDAAEAGDAIDGGRHRGGNYFHTVAQAGEAARRVKEALLKYQDEIAGECEDD